MLTVIQARTLLLTRDLSVRGGEIVPCGLLVRVVGCGIMGTVKPKAEQDIHSEFWRGVKVG